MDPIRRYKPKRVDDGDGTITETLDESTALTVYGWVAPHKSTLVGVTDKLIVNKHEDVFPGNIVVPLEDEAAAQYRVIASQGVASSGFREHSLERIKRPIRPLAGGFDSGFDSGFP